MKITRKEILNACEQAHINIPNINSGGCGVFAFLLGNMLQQYENCKVRVKVSNWRGEARHLNKAIPEDKSSIYNWGKNGIDFYHIVLKVKLKGQRVFYIDSEGIYKNFFKSAVDYGWHSRMLAGSMPVEYLEDIVSTCSGWNDVFYRYNIPNIVEIFEQNFSGIKAPNLNGWDLH